MLLHYIAGQNNRNNPKEPQINSKHSFSLLSIRPKLQQLHYITGLLCLPCCSANSLYIHYQNSQGEKNSLTVTSPALRVLRVSWYLQKQTNKKISINLAILFFFASNYISIKINSFPSFKEHKDMLEQNPRAVVGQLRCSKLSCHLGHIHPIGGSAGVLVPSP